MAKRQWRLIEASMVLLFTFQAIRVFFSMLFAQIYDALFDGEGMTLLVAGGALLLLMIVAPLFSPHDDKKIEANLRITAVLCAIARCPLSIDMPIVRLASAALTITFAGVYVTGLLRSRAFLLPMAMSSSLVIDMLLRAMGHTFDLSLRPYWGLVQIALALGVLRLAEWLLKHDPEPAPADEAGFRSGLSYGASLFLLSSLYALPNAAARWTASPYTLCVTAMLVLTTAPLWAAISRWQNRGPLATNRWLRILVMAFLLVSLPLTNMDPSAWSVWVLLEGVAAFWLLLPLNLHLGQKHTALGMACGTLLFVLLAVLHALSYTYAYVSSLFKDMGLVAFMIAAIVGCGLAVWPNHQPSQNESPLSHRPRFWLALGGTAVVIATLFAWPVSPNTRPFAATAKLATYNMHYGYDSHWHLSLIEQARAIKESGADVIALQEVDAGRLTSFGVDHTYWLGRKLGMETIYLPTVEHTTGIAMLSNLKITESMTTLLPSHEEPTGMIRATVTVNGAAVQTHGVWLGLSPAERARQLDAALAQIDSGVATFAGDLNATPDSAAYSRLSAAGFIDPFVTLDVSRSPTSPSEYPRERIDYVWLRCVEPLQARVLDSIASDHRLVVVEVH